MATGEVNRRPSLPPYPEMILMAIDALSNANGSNKSSISKYIESTYGDLPAGHSALLSHHLNRMKDSGELVFWKNNYSRPDPNSPPRRGRGRPPKAKEPVGPGMMAEDVGPARPRGRPPKDPNAPPKPPKAKAEPALSASGKPRGRPRKMARPAGGLGGDEGGVGPTGKGRGRPPKVKAPQFAEVSVQ